MSLRRLLGSALAVTLLALLSLSGGTAAQAARPEATARNCYGNGQRVFAATDAGSGYIYDSWWTGIVWWSGRVPMGFTDCYDINGRSFRNMRTGSCQVDEVRVRFWDVWGRQTGVTEWKPMNFCNGKFRVIAAKRVGWMRLETITDPYSNELRM